jgi:hypothetical protein
MSHQMSKRGNSDPDFEPNKRHKGSGDEGFTSSANGEVFGGTTEAKESLHRIKGLLKRINSKLTTPDEIDSDHVMETLESLSASAKSREEVSAGIADITKYLAYHEACYWDDGKSPEIKNMSTSYSCF